MSEYLPHIYFDISKLKHWKRLNFISNKCLVGKLINYYTPNLSDTLFTNASRVFLCCDISFAKEKTSSLTFWFNLISSLHRYNHISNQNYLRKVLLVNFVKKLNLFKIFILSSLCFFNVCLIIFKIIWAINWYKFIINHQHLH